MISISPHPMTHDSMPSCMKACFCIVVDLTALSQCYTSRCARGQNAVDAKNRSPVSASSGESRLYGWQNSKSRFLLAQRSHDSAGRIISMQLVYHRTAVATSLVSSENCSCRSRILCTHWPQASAASRYKSTGYLTFTYLTSHWLNDCDYTCFVSCRRLRADFLT